MSESNLTSNALQSQETQGNATCTEAEALSRYLDDLFELSEQFSLPKKTEVAPTYASTNMGEIFASRLKESSGKKMQRQVIILSNQESPEFVTMMLLLQIADTAVKRGVAILTHHRLLDNLSSLRENLQEAEAAGKLLAALRGDQYQEESEYLSQLLAQATNLSEQTTGVIKHEEDELRAFLLPYCVTAQHGMDLILDYVKSQAEFLATLQEVYRYPGNYWDSRKEFFGIVANFLKENDYVRRNRALYVFAGERLAEQKKEGVE